MTEDIQTMESTSKAKQPRPGTGRKRRTLILDEFLWDRLKAIEEETGAGPSFTARRILSKALLDEATEGCVPQQEA
jgi:hypothetical protein